jgi:hypothetical protein
VKDTVPLDSGRTGRAVRAAVIGRVKRRMTCVTDMSLGANIPCCVNSVTSLGAHLWNTSGRVNPDVERSEGKDTSLRQRGWMKRRLQFGLSLFGQKCST